MAVVTSFSSLSSLIPSPPRFSSPLFYPILAARLRSHCHKYHLRLCPAPRASQRAPNFPQESDGLFNKSRRWAQVDFWDEYDGEDEDEDDDEDDEEEEDRSLDLLIRFVENVFRKVSRRARKAVRSVLPVSISTKLVGFAVNGALILAFLWVLKAFIEVICTLGSVIFVSILLIRGVWSGVAYLQENRNLNLHQDNDGPSWAGARPAN
ncbi:hypothetical protein V2J09_021364 [Rumex salicifolius]